MPPGSTGSTRPPGTVHFVVPAGVDDPERPSGGNTYDRRVGAGLTALGWSVREHPVPGSWPRPAAAGRAALAAVLAQIPDNAVVLLDGLIASASPEVLVPTAHRLRLVVLVHLPRCGPSPTGVTPTAMAPGHGWSTDADADPGCDAAVRSEQAVLAAATAVITTSRWTRRSLLQRYSLPPNKVHVATPGVDAADLAPGTATGGELLCVAAVTPGKGHDILLSALAMVSELVWDCSCVGSLTRDPDFVNRLRRQAAAAGIEARVSFTGPRTGRDLAAAYAAADVLVLASRIETYGMVITEALARAIPVIVADVGGTPEAIGRAPDGTRPGMLVTSGDAVGLAAALRCWLGDPARRAGLRRAALGRRSMLADWSRTSMAISTVLSDVCR